MQLPSILAPKALAAEQQTLLADFIAAGHCPVLSEIYCKREIKNIAGLDYQLKNLPHPEKMKGTPEAAILLSQAILNQQKIIIIADYDCDGATSCAVAILGIQAIAKALNLAVDVDFVVPNRFIHGYGLTPEIIDLIIETHPVPPNLIITVDNGISSVEGVAYAKLQSWQVLITDHHLSSKVLPAADAIVNPNQPACTFESKAIAGVGVIFYVLLATRLYLKSQGFFQQSQPKLDHLLDLVALGTVADVARLDWLNRIFVEHGLQHLKLGEAYPYTNLGIKALLEMSGKNVAKFKAQDFGFMLGPRLNAAGRLDDMRIGILCLLSKTMDEARNYAAQLDGMNKARKKIEFDMKQDVDIDQNQLGASICLYQADWHQGVIGILAARLKDKYYRPTFIFANNSLEDDGLIKASGRSIAGFHIKDAIDLIVKQYPNMITKFGGHAMAAGLTMHHSQFDLFVEAFETIAKTQLTKQQLEKTIQTDLCLSLAQHDATFIKSIQEKIWGQGFPAPIFYQQAVIEDIQILKETHSKLKLRISENNLNNLNNSENHFKEIKEIVFDAIWFGVAMHQLDRLENWRGAKVQIAYELDQNIWQNEARTQLIIQGLERL